MKLIYMILHNAKRIIIQNRSTFIIIFFSLTITTFGVLFYSGFILHSYSERRANQTGSTISIWLHKDTDINILEDIINTFRMDDNLVQKILISEKPIEDLKDSITIVGEYNNIHLKRIVKGRYFLSGENKAIMILPEALVENVVGYNISPLNQTVQVYDFSLKIIGIASFFYIDYLAVPINYYINHLPSKYIEVTYEQKLNSKEKAIIYSCLDEYSCIKDITISVPKSMILSLSFWMEFSQILIIFIISIISLFSIILFWIKQYKKTYNIYSICGSSHITILFLISGQMNVIILGSTLTGCLLYCFNKPFFIKNDLAEPGNHLFYISIYFILLLLTLISTFLLVRKANKNNDIYLINE